MADRKFGPGVDHEIWSRIPAAAGGEIGHRLWCAVIREVAAATLERKPASQPSSEDSNALTPEDLASEWQNDALPVNASIAWVLGELDYFRDIDLSWEEKISLSGEACGYASDIVWDLQGKLEEYPDARDAVTEDAVEDFFVEWRTGFLLRVLRAAEALAVEEPK